MASPQIENGFTRIANEIMEALMRTNFPAYQGRVLWAILRETYGFQKKEDWISNSQLVEMTGLRKQHISRTMKELLERHIVTRSGYKVGFNKDYTQWRELPRQVTVTSSGYKVTSRGDHSNLTRGTQKKKVLKETTTPGFQPVVDFYYQTVEDNKGFKPALNNKDFAAVKRELKRHGEDRVKNLILFFLDSEKADKHLSLSAALSADTINQYNLKWQKAKFQYGDDASTPTGEIRWWA